MDIYDKIMKILCDVFELPELDDVFSDTIISDQYDMDEDVLMLILEEINKTFDIKVTLSDIENLKTINEYIEFLQNY